MLSPDDVASPEEATHPYDKPHAIIQNLRKDVAELKAMLHTEQQLRASEVKELRTTIETLRSCGRVEISPVHTAIEKLTLDLDTRVSGLNKALDEVKAQNRLLLEPLKCMLQEEIRDRKSCETIRDNREQSKESEFKSAIQLVRDELAEQKEKFCAFKDEQVNDTNNLIHDIDILVKGLVKVGQIAQGKDSSAKDDLAPRLFCFG